MLIRPQPHPEEARRAVSKGGIHSAKVTSRDRDAGLSLPRGIRGARLLRMRLSVTQHSMKASTRCGCYLMPETLPPSLVRAYSARPRSGLSSRSLIFTKLSVDFRLSKAYVSRSKKGVASWSFTATVPRPQPPPGLRWRKTTGGNGGNARNLMLAAVRGRQCQQPCTVKEAKTGSGNCGKCGN